MIARSPRLTWCAVGWLVLLRSQVARSAQSTFARHIWKSFHAVVVDAHSYGPLQAPPRLQAGFRVQIYANASTAFMLRLAALAGCNELVRNPRLTDEGYVDSQGYVDSH